MQLKNLIKKIRSLNIINNYMRMYPYVKPYWIQAILSILVTIPVGTMDAAIAWILKPYMDTVMIAQSMKNTSLLPALVILFSMLQSAFNYSATYLNAWVGSKITMDLRKDLFKIMMHKDPAFFDKNTSGYIQMRFNNDANAACGGLLSNMKLFTTKIISSVSLIGVLLYNSWQLTCIALIFLFAALYPLLNIRKRLKSTLEKTVASGSEIVTHYNEAFSGNRVVTSYNLYDYQNARFTNTLNAMFKLQMNMIKKTGMLSPVMHFIVSIGIAGTIWMGSWLINTEQLTPGGFVSFITALLMLYTPIKSIGANISNVQMSFMAMERVFQVLDAKPTITSKENAVVLNGVKKGITYDNVCFEYVNKKPVLKNVSLKIKAGETVAFVGNSGGGKTTFVNLLPRFYDIKSGAISIDGVDIRDMDLNSLRENIAVVFQDNVLFAGTIRENILLGKEDATAEELDAAVNNSCLKEFIDSLTDGLDTEIGERGIRLSGGQRQRIAIARAFIKNAPIVILDEATSALDNQSEHIVQQAIYNLMKDRTVLIVAHRLSTVINADKIVVINKGKIAEIGTHKELIAKDDSIYASLYKTQLK